MHQYTRADASCVKTYLVILIFHQGKTTTDVNTETIMWAQVWNQITTPANKHRNLTVAEAILAALTLLFKC